MVIRSWFPGIGSDRRRAESVGPGKVFIFSVRGFRGEVDSDREIHSADIGAVNGQALAHGSERVDNAT